MTMGRKKKVDKRDSQLTLRVKGSLKRWLTKLANKHGTTKSMLVSGLLEDYKEWVEKSPGSRW